MQAPFTERDEYQSTGKVGLEFVVAAIPFAFVAAMLTGAALFGIWRLGFYFIVIMPFLMSIPVAAAAGFGVGIGKCRNRGIAIAYGILTGALMYGSYFYFDMLGTWGADNLVRVDRVPRHIWFRLQTDRLEVHPGGINKNDQASPWLMNLFFCTVDLVLICAISAIPAAARSRRVFCERTGRWARLRILPLQPGMGEPIFSALLTGHLDECLAGRRIIPIQVQQPYCELVLEECGEIGDADECCAYISLREIAQASKSKVISHYAGFEKFLVRQRELTVEELRVFQKHYADDQPQPVSNPSPTAVPAMSRIRRRLTPYLLAAVLIAAGGLLLLLPGAVISTQLKIVKGEVHLPRLVLELNNWCYSYLSVIQPAALIVGIALILGGIIIIKVNLSHAVASALAPPPRVEVVAPLPVVSHKIEVAPAWVHERVVEASPERLVLHLPAAGWGATIFFWLALGWFALAVVGCVSAVGEIAQGADSERFALPGVFMVVGSIFAMYFAVKLKFERTFLLLDRERLVVQHVLLGIKRRTETILVPSSRAEIIAPHEHGLSLDGVKVMGQNGTARFGNKLAQQDCQWLAGKINAFLEENHRAAETAELAGLLQPDELARDSAIRIDAASPDVLRFHYLANQEFPHRALRVAISVFLVVACLMACVPFFLFPRILNLMGTELFFVGFVVGTFVLSASVYVWIAAFGRISVTVTREMMTRRHQIFGIDISRRQTAATATIGDVLVEFGSGANAAEGWLTRTLGSVAKAVRPPVEYWAVICAADPPIVLPGFLRDSDARQAASLIMSHIRKSHLAG
jgi:hypothetical protein